MVSILTKNNRNIELKWNHITRPEVMGRTERAPREDWDLPCDMHTFVDL